MSFSISSSAGFEVSILPHATPPKMANFSTASSKFFGLCSL
ncbi:hypothetical protein [Sulfurimonas paralvinellae]|nr:hypothetical protein [Sulfurimonas paralvinellae]